MFKKRVLSLALVLSLSICSFLPVAADTTSRTDTTSANKTVAITDSQEKALFESQQFKDAMAFLITYNNARLKKGLTPISTTEEMLLAAQIRAKELESSYTKYRPTGDHWSTIYTDQHIIHQDSSLYDGFGFYGTEGIDIDTIYKDCRSAHSSVLNYNNISILGIGRTSGTVSYYDEKTKTTSEKQNPWAILLLGKYSIKKMELATPLKDCYTAGYKLGDMDIILRLTLISPEGKECISYLPLVQSMSTGYDPDKTGTQSVTVTYKDTFLSQQATLTFDITTATGKTPATPEIFKATGTSYDEVTIEWSPAANAYSYEIYRSKKKKSDYKKIDSVKASKLTLSAEGLYTYVDDDVKNGIKYYYKLKAVNGSVKGAYTSVDEALPNIKAPANLRSIKKSKNSITVKWTKVKKATSYRVYYSTKKSGKFKRATKPSTKKCSYTIKKLKKKKTYYIKVLAYRDGRPSSYSKTIQVKTK